MPTTSTRLDFLITDGDLDLSSGDLAFSSGVSGVKQGIEIALNMFRGEWDLNLDTGIPWLANGVISETEAILGQRDVTRLAREAVRDLLLDTPGVFSILKLTTERVTRDLRIDWEVDTVFGENAAGTKVF